MPRHGQRRNHAWRIAYYSDIKRIYYAITFSSFAHPWALYVLKILIPSAITVLEFLASLNRCSKSGYIGCACAYELLAPQIASATNRKCSVRTLERGLAFLKRIGLVTLSWYTMPDYKTPSGVIVPGTRRVLTRHGWRNRQIRVVTLTRRALALWDRSTRNRGSEFIPHFTHFLTSAKLADSPKIDSVVKTTEYTDPRKSKQPNQSLVKDVLLEGTTTRPESRAMPGSPTIEHHALTVPRSKQPAKSSAERSSDIAERRGVSDNLQLTRNRESDTTKTDNLSLPSNTVSSNPMEKTARQGGSLRGTGEKREKPGRKNRQTWSESAKIILASLYDALETYPRRHAQSMYRRAQYELRHGACQSSTDWAYWIGRFPAMSREQRNYHVRRDIIPVLKMPPAIPNEKLKFPEQKHDIGIGKAADKTPTKKLLPFFQEFWRKFVDDQ